MICSISDWDSPADRLNDTADVICLLTTLMACRTDDVSLNNHDLYGVGVIFRAVENTIRDAVKEIGDTAQATSATPEFGSAEFLAELKRMAAVAKANTVADPADTFPKLDPDEDSTEDKPRPQQARRRAAGG